MMSGHDVGGWSEGATGIEPGEQFRQEALPEPFTLRRGPARGGRTLVDDGPAGDAERLDEAGAARVVSACRAASASRERKRP